jgi:hypothetical protein
MCVCASVTRLSLTHMHQLLPTTRIMPPLCNPLAAENDKSRAARWTLGHAPWSSNDDDDTSMSARPIPRRARNLPVLLLLLMSGLSFTTANDSSQLVMATISQSNAWRKSRRYLQGQFLSTVPSTVPSVSPSLSAAPTRLPSTKQQHPTMAPTAGKAWDPGTCVPAETRVRKT